MLQSYKDYWKEHDAPCVGMVRVDGCVYSVHSDASWNRPWWVWFTPKILIGWDKSGLCVTMNGLKKVFW